MVFDFISHIASADGGCEQFGEVEFQSKLLCSLLQIEMARCKQCLSVAYLLFLALCQLRMPSSILESTNNIVAV